MSQNNTWVIAELTDDTIHTATFELLAKAQELKEKNKEAVTAVLLETTNINHEETLIHYGADQVLVVKDDRFETYNAQHSKEVIVTLAKKYKPSIILMSATLQGRSLAPRIQGALKTGLTADCLDLSINEEGKLVQIKPSYGDNLMCTILIPHTTPQMTTIRPNVFVPLEIDTTKTGEIITETIPFETKGIYEVIDTVPLKKKADNIQDAKTIVAIGRGIRSQSDLPILETLANQINAKIGVTRPLAENGWYTIEEQIGQSGYTVMPDLILNFGIAGAVQYTVGMKQSKTVFSVNKDEHAVIFKESDYGYVGDAKTFAQELSKLLK